MDFSVLSVELGAAALGLGLAAGALVLGVGLSQLVLLALRVWSRRTDGTLDDLVAKYLSAPLRILVPLVALLVALPAIHLPTEVLAVARQLAVIGCVASGTWLAVRCIEVGERWLLERFDPAKTDPLVARSVETRVRVGRNVALFVVVGLGFGVALTTIEPVRQLGTSLLASAGVAGVVLGVAASAASPPCSPACRSPSPSPSASATS